MVTKNSFTLLRIGLGLVFLANALTAWLAPAEFGELISGSFVVNLFPMIPVATFVTLILINDSILALILLFNLKLMKHALVWASIWIILVILVGGSITDGIEHLGFLAMSVALFLELRNHA